MSEKLLWSLKVEGLAEGHDWKELEKLSKEKKMPPIGIEPFVEACKFFKIKNAVRIGLEN